MNRIRPLFVSAAGLGLSALLLTFGSCGGGTTSGPAPSYTITAAALNPASVTAGSASTSAVTVTPANGYAGTVDLSCKNTIGGMPAPTCSFSVSPVVITGTSPGTSMMTVTTSKNTAGGSYTILVTGKDATNVAPSNGSQTLTLTTAAGIQHVVVIFQENRSTDNLFHDSVLISRGADIASSGLNSHGQTIPLSPINLGNIRIQPSELRPRPRSRRLRRHVRRWKNGRCGPGVRAV